VKRKKNDNHIILFFIPTPTMEDELFLPSNEYIILDESDTNVLIKIEFRPLIRHTDQWVYNRIIDDSKVKEYYDSIKENNDIKWHLSAVKEKSSDNFILIDGQHRYEAIKLYLEKYDIQMECNKFVYVNAIKIDNIEKDNEYIIDLFKKINNNKPLTDEDVPSFRITNLIADICKDKILSKGISRDPKHHTSHKPRFHVKQLNAFFNTNIKHIENMTNDEIITNLKELNHRLSLMTITDIYSNRETNKKVYDTACSLGFFIGITDSLKYKPDKWIKKIKNIDSLFA
jgi:hypothetical protein